MDQTSPPTAAPIEDAQGALPIAGARLQRIVLLSVVFLGGMTSLAVELAASRLLAPYFGDSLFIWAILIGMELIYLTIGYYIGGRWADRHPTAPRLYTLVLIAAGFIALVPVLSRPILTISLRGFASLDVGAFVGSLIGTILLFAIPVTLLGMVTPFAIRLEITKVDQAGNTSGQIYALSTIGSILGTFLPVFVFIPTIGTAMTFLLFGSLLLIGALVGLWLAGARPTLGRLGSFFSLVMIASIIFTAQPHTIKAGFDGKLVVEKESLYNYIQVVKNGDTYQLILNEGQAIHSLYNPNQLLSGGEWDLFLMSPLFNNPPYTASDLHSVAVIGLGAGTIPNIITNTYGGKVAIDGVELDPEIVQLGRQYFNMREPNLHVYVNDGRYYLELTKKSYDLIAIDAYQQPYIPFQLTTKEFFQLARDHLTPHGVVAINAGRAGNDYRLVNALATTMHAVFKHVYAIDIEENTIITATNDDSTSLGNLAINAQLLTQPNLQLIAGEALTPTANLRVAPANSIVLTDDRAPVETIINQIILGYIRTGN